MMEDINHPDISCHFVLLKLECLAPTPRVRQNPAETMPGAEVVKNEKRTKVGISLGPTTPNN